MMKIIMFTRLLVGPALLLAAHAVPAVGSAQSSAREDECWETAMTSQEMAACAQIRLDAAEAALDSVLSAIAELHREDPEFLAALSRAQDAWGQLLDADLEATYPGWQSGGRWGTALYQCLRSTRAALVERRVEFLRQWLGGALKGDVCNGTRPVGG